MISGVNLPSTTSIGVFSITVAAPFLPLWVGQGMTALAVGLLLFSFGRDIATQERTAAGRL